MDLHDLKDAEAFQRVFVKPLVDAVRLEVKPLVDSDKQQSERLAALEGNQKKALIGFSVYATVLSVGLGVMMDKIKRKLGW